MTDEEREVEVVAEALFRLRNKQHFNKAFKMYGDIFRGSARCAIAAIDMHRAERDKKK